MIINDIHFHSITRYKRYIDSEIYKRLSASTLTRQQNTNIEAEPSRLAQPKNYHKSHYLQGVPPICWQVQTKFWKLKNYMSQKVSPVLKFLGKKLLDGTLKPRKIKLEVFLNWISKKSVKFQKGYSTLPLPPITFHHHPLNIKKSPSLFPHHPLAISLNFFPASPSHHHPLMILPGGGGGRGRGIFWYLGID